MPPRLTAVIVVSFVLVAPGVVAAQEEQPPDLARRLEDLEQRLEAQSFALQRLAKKIDDVLWFDRVGDVADIDKVYIPTVPAPNAEEGLKNLVARVRGLLTDLDVPLKLRDFGIAPEDFEAKLPKLVEYSYGDIDCYLSPRPITADQCERVFKYAYEGKDIDF